MVKALLLIARWIAAAHERWCTTTAARRPLLVELAALRKQLTGRSRPSKAAPRWAVPEVGYIDTHRDLPVLRLRRAA